MPLPLIVLGVGVAATIPFFKKKVRDVYKWGFKNVVNQAAEAVNCKPVFDDIEEDCDKDDK